jgi:hypothetical protein
VSEAYNLKSGYGVINKQGTHHDELLRGPGWLNELGSWIT